MSILSYRCAIGEIDEWPPFWIKKHLLRHIKIAFDYHDARECVQNPQSFPGVMPERPEEDGITQRDSFKQTDLLIVTTHKDSTDEMIDACWRPMWEFLAAAPLSKSVVINLGNCQCVMRCCRLVDSLAAEIEVYGRTHYDVDWKPHTIYLEGLYNQKERKCLEKALGIEKSSLVVKLDLKK